MGDFFETVVGSSSKPEKCVPAAAPARGLGANPCQFTDLRGVRRGQMAGDCAICTTNPIRSTLARRFPASPSDLVHPEIWKAASSDLFRFGGSLVVEMSHLNKYLHDSVFPSAYKNGFTFTLIDAC